LILVRLITVSRAPAITRSNREPKPPQIFVDGMPTYRVSIINEHFSQDGQHEAPDTVTAWKKAIKATIEIAADQVSHGNPFFGAEVRLEDGDKQIGRYVVSVGATPLKD